jgi:hypothetical protein
VDDHALEDVEPNTKKRDKDDSVESPLGAGLRRAWDWLGGRG